VIKKNIFLLLWSLAIFNLFGEDVDPDKTNPEALQNVLKLEIGVNLIKGSEKLSLSTKGFRYTYPGKAVNIKIEGNSMKMIGSFTPYYDRGGNLILLAQGQIFIANPEGTGFRYYSYFKSIPAILGEELQFFPLGFSAYTTPENAANIEIDIQILSFNQSAPVKENNK
jgi:hypothetical protein